MGALLRFIEQGRIVHRPLVAVPNVTDYPSMASVPISTDPLLMYQM